MRLPLRYHSGTTCGLYRPGKGFAHRMSLVSVTIFDNCTLPPDKTLVHSRILKKQSFDLTVRHDSKLSTRRVRFAIFQF